jgi:serine/threonine protein kinase
MSTTPDPRARVDALFEQALEYEGEARMEFLDRVAADDPALRDELAQLLEFAERPAPQLDPQALAGGALWQALAVDLERDDDGRESGPTTHDITGRIVGAWRLLRELGRGGMGTVYLAERVGADFEQRAALKLIRTGVDSDEFLRRFAQERQILAAFNHPNIARLFDGGRDGEGRPYLVMEHVEGRTLDRYCDAEMLTIEQRVVLFAQIGRAVAHAHRHLVVHRDLKPSNIVVTSDGEVKLLDFGIAKVLSQTGAPDEPLTRTAVRLFTPEYATPEQVRGQPVTTAADVYQLGLLLYELLTGTRAQAPLDDSPSALEQAVCEREPVRPSAQADDADAATLAARRTTASALRRKLRGDLDNIVLKALRKAPERRYASAAELVDDLERWRLGRPVRARRETAGYRAGKFLRRHPFGVAASTLALMVRRGRHGTA